MKNGGCPHMVCAKCHYEMCWKCMGSYKAYKHLPGRKELCGYRTLIDKTFIVLLSLFCTVKLWTFTEGMVSLLMPNFILNALALLSTKLSEIIDSVSDYAGLPSVSDITWSSVSTYLV